MTEIICTCCPKGCHLHVDEEKDYAVTGYGCPRGAEYGRNEVSNPVRVLTSTVRITGALYRRCPVKTDRPVSKGLLLDIMKKLNDVEVSSPVTIGQVVLENADGLGANIIVTKNL